MSASNSRREKYLKSPSKFTFKEGVVPMAKLTPLGERVLVRRVQEADTVRGGIIIPDTAKEKPQEGVVMAVGTGRYDKGQHVPMTVKEGDRVLFGKYSGSDIKIDGEEFLILKEEEIFGILSGSAKPVEREKATAGRR
jgi:chaperonin GroES